MPDLKLRWIFGAAVVLLALAFANPALAAPKLCGCWCKLVFPLTACTEVTPLGNAVTTCSDWLSRHWDQCAEPGPFFAPAELEPSLPESPDLPALDVKQEPVEADASVELCSGLAR